MGPMRVLLDAGIFIHAEFAEGAVRRTVVKQDDTDIPVEVNGVIRKAPNADDNYQKQVDALFTVGRLIREGQIEAFDSWEIQCECVRGTREIKTCYALRGCAIRRCCVPLERSKFHKTPNIKDLLSKGGEKDRKTGVELGTANQMAFFSWLHSLTQEQVDVLIQHSADIGFTQFEIDSLHEIRWFQLLCDTWQKTDNYPDIFHLWTAERNGLHAILTLEKKIPNFVANVRRDKRRQIEIRTRVLRPLELLQSLGISDPDPVPIVAGRFYHLHEVP